MSLIKAMRLCATVKRLLRVCGAIPLLFSLGVASARAQGTPETFGRLDGEDVAVKGQISLVREGTRNSTLLASGSEVTVRSGFARIRLEEGGEVGVCGPASFSVHNSGGSLTLALNYGRFTAPRISSGINTF
jgi:hypothetical protein